MRDLDEDGLTICPQCSKHYRKSIRRCARRWAFGRDPTMPCDGWCQK